MKYVDTFLFILICCVAVAQSDPKAKEILDKAAAKFKAYPAVEIEFTLAMENSEENIKEIHHGKAWMKGNLYKLDLMDVENYYDGQNIYTYMPEYQEVNIKNPNEAEEEILNPTTLFDIHNKGFEQKLLGHADGVAYIELFPMEKSRSFEKIGVWVNTTNAAIQKVTSFGKDGTQMTVIVDKIKPISPVPADSFFKFDAASHPQAEIIDLR